MDPTEKDWLARFIELRADISLKFKTGPPWTVEKQVYKYLQPTGVIYGHPVELPTSLQIDTEPWPVKERFEVIFVESLLSTYSIYHSLQKPSMEDLHEATEAINGFYLLLYPELTKKGFFESTPKTTTLQLEKILAKRIKVKPEWNAHFWKGFFHNILLFVDLLLFLEYLNSEMTFTAEQLQQRNIDIQKNIISFMSVVVNVSESQPEQNQNFFNYFVESTGLDKKEKEMLVKEQPNFDLGELSNFLNKSDWLIQKYFLELAVLSVWADLEAETEEILMLGELAEKLKLDPVELETSSFAVESFVMLHWKQVHYLQSKQSYLVLSKRLTQRMTKISKKYGAQIKKEIAENKELLILLKISQERNLSLHEKEKMRTQLIDILKSIPAFLVLAMPMAFLTVPILMKVLPKNLFPSSFDPNRMVNKRGNRVEEG